MSSETNESPDAGSRETRLALAERKLKGIEAICLALATEPNLTSILTVVMEQAKELLDAERATLFVLDGTEQGLASRVTRGGEVETIRLPFGQGIAGWVAQHGRSVNVKDAYRDPRFDASYDQKTGFRTGSVLCVPMWDSGHDLVGVIQVLNRRTGYFTTHDEGLLQAIASPAAISIHNVRLYEDVVDKNISLQETARRLKRRKAELELLYRVEQAAATAISVESAAEGVLRATLEEFPCEMGAVVIGQGGGEPARYVAVSGARGEELEASRVFLGDGLDLGQPCVWNTVEPDAVLLPPGAGDWVIRQMVSLPIRHKQELFGRLQLVNRESGRPWTDEEVRLLGGIARRVGEAMALARAIEEEQKAERLAHIGQMMAAVVHDLKTPLTVIAGYARLMAREEGRDQREQCRSKIRGQIGDMIDMTEDLLSFARGDTEVLLQKVFVSDFLDEVREVLKREMENTDCSVTVEATYKGACRLDSKKMKRVVYNLAKNAREAMGDRGAFEVRVGADEEHINFSFSDTGPGIPPEMEGRMFESFSTHGKENGTGLGLAIVQSIVHEHHGRIDVNSTAGEGTTFTISLPR